MKSRWLRAASAIGVAVTVPWPLLYLLAYTSTCTMGDDDSWGATIFFCGIITVLSLPLLAASFSIRQRLRLAVPVLTLIPLLFSLPDAITNSFGAQHLCGVEYDSYFAEGWSWSSRWFYRAMWTYGAALSLASVAPWVLRARRGHAQSQGAA